MNNNDWDKHRFSAVQKYLLGYTIGKISGDTGIPVIRLKRELEFEVKRNPSYTQRRAQSMYAKRRRWAGAVLVMEPKERYRAVNEY